MKLFKFNSKPGKPLIHLAHANGFPPPTYRQMVRPLLSRYQVMALPARPLWPGSDPEQLKDWSLLTGDLLEGLRPLGRRQVIGIGHSLGGVLTLTAALREPERFSRIILIDATMPAPTVLWRFEWMRRLGLTPRKDLVRGALRRRRHWDSREAAFLAFAGKPLFKSWKKGVLRDYVEGMTAPGPRGGVDLVYPPEWEARIYQTIPTDVWKGIHELRMPVLVIRGENSNTFTALSEKAFAERLPSARLESVPGAGHLVPFEKPVETAKLILDFLGA